MEILIKFLVIILCFDIAVNGLPILENKLNDIKEDRIISVEDAEISEKIQITEINKEILDEDVRHIRPGMYVSHYEIDIEPDIESETFTGKLIAQISLTDISSSGDPILLHVEDLEIESVLFAIAGGNTYRDADFDVDDGILTIETGANSLTYNLIIEYEGIIRNDGNGLYMGWYDDDK